MTPDGTGWFGKRSGVTPRAPGCAPVSRVAFFSFPPGRTRRRRSGPYGRIEARPWSRRVRSRACARVVCVHGSGWRTRSRLGLALRAARGPGSFQGCLPVAPLLSGKVSGDVRFHRACWAPLRARGVPAETRVSVHECDEYVTPVHSWRRGASRAFLAVGRPVHREASAQERLGPAGARSPGDIRVVPDRASASLHPLDGAGTGRAARRAFAASDSAWRGACPHRTKRRVQRGGEGA